MIRILDFWAPWCGPCRLMHPILDTLEQENPNVRIERINVEAEPERATAYEIVSVPALIFMRDNQEVRRVIGTKSINDLRDILADI